MVIYGALINQEQPLYPWINHIGTVLYFFLNTIINVIMCLGYPSFVIDQETDLLSIASTPVANEYCSSSIIPLQCLHQIYTTLVLYEYSRVVPTNVWSTSISISRYRVYSKYINMLHYYIAFFFPNCTRSSKHIHHPILYDMENKQ